VGPALGLDRSNTNLQNCVSRSAPRRCARETPPPSKSRRLLNAEGRLEEASTAAEEALEVARDNAQAKTLNRVESGRDNRERSANSRQMEGYCLRRTRNFVPKIYCRPMKS